MIVNFDVFPNEEGIIYTGENQYGEMKVKYFDFKTKENTILFTEFENPLSVKLSGNGNILIFHNNRDCYTYNFNNKELKQIFKSIDSKGSCFGTLNKSGELASYVVSSQYSPFINLYNSKTSESISIKDSESGIRFPYFSHSSHYLAYTKQYLNDINKRKHVEIYNYINSKTFVIPKEKESDCVINCNCFSNQDELFYLEVTNNEQVVKRFNIKDQKITTITSMSNLREVGFIDSNHLLLIFDNALIKFNLTTKLETKITLNSDEKLLFRPCGSEIRIIKGSIYFLTDKKQIYCWYNGTLDLVKIVDTEVEVKPIKDMAYADLSFNNRIIPIYYFEPLKKNGQQLILAIGGPGEKVSDDDRILLHLLNQGYEVFVPAYRGCKENPYIEDEMGKVDVLDLIDFGKHLAFSLGPLPLVGYSYGGLLTFLALANSESVFSCGISLWGVTSVDKLKLFEKYYFSDNLKEIDKERILKERNAVHMAKNIRTPLLICHGAKDTTSNCEEVQMIYNQLICNNVKCELIIYEDDTHGLKNHTNEYLKEVSNFINLCKKA